jgi:hypothetical protein
MTLALARFFLVRRRMSKLAPTLTLLAMLTAGCSSSSNPYGDGGPPAPKTIVINEVFAGGTSVTDPDWVELKNLTAAVVDLGGYKLRDNMPSDLSTISAGFSIEAGGYFIIYCDDQADGGVPGGVHVPWKLSSKKGDEVHLYDPADVEIDSTTFGIDVPADKSWGRLPDGTGGFVRTSPTQGTANL